MHEILLGLSILSVSAAYASENDTILFVETGSIPERPFDGVIFMPINKLELLNASWGYKFEKVTKIVVTLKLLSGLSFQEQIAVKDYLRSEFNSGKQVWIVGSPVPDNFLLNFLNVETGGTWHQSDLSWVLASGLWKENGRTISHNFVARLQSLEEILRHIRNR